MIENPNDPWFQDMAARRSAGESDVEFYLESKATPGLWEEHPHVLRAEAEIRGDVNWVHLWLPYPAWSDQDYPRIARFEPARSPDIIIANVGKMPPHRFWSLHPLVEFDRTEFDNDGGGSWKTSIWLRQVTASEADTAALLAGVFDFNRKAKP